jgi:hypothetical protein
VVYYKYNFTWYYVILNKQDSTFTAPLSRISRKETRQRGGEIKIDETVEKLSRIAISAVDRMGNESEQTVITVETAKNPAPSN